MGGQTSKLQDELERTNKELAAARVMSTELQQANQELHEQVRAQQGKLQQRESELATAARDCAQRLDAKHGELLKAIKQKEIAEELRRSDALLVKRVTAAILKKHRTDGPLKEAHDLMVGGGMAAEALAANDEQQLRQALISTSTRLGDAQAQVLQLQQVHSAEARHSLCDILWQPQLCDASLSLRSSNFMVLGGLRAPRSPTQFNQRGNGLCGGVGVLRRFGEPSFQEGRWGAFGGSLLWDVRERELAALRFALCMQAAPSQQLSASFDHNGNVSGRVSASVDALTIRLNGTVDLNRTRESCFGVELSYDLD
mmetsp:Transcript_8790/g.14742  ORF Transcript_8790/g.14742 Transcript_8790/m.14742 type:complete len:313 (+) Transcript_8790:33-971(+)|eukprot:CAMPEP_0119298996 /NCGR_PEP_ID=MMETSP1333-20130426/1127_1 /TAXON_ID=418940 /ORGANISM="Scyphosphaera apsteinii, Strain RCC1455" /LENGTH=312 /DNA_ID=CAMNT_0007300267 /DNA_START=68 /DNA_END=1006 /DNA_ORIENTATION=+